MKSERNTNDMFNFVYPIHIMVSKIKEHFYETNNYYIHVCILNAIYKHGWKRCGKVEFMEIPEYNNAYGTKNLTAFTNSIVSEIRTINSLKKYSDQEIWEKVYPLVNSIISASKNSKAA